MNIFTVPPAPVVGWVFPSVASLNLLYLLHFLSLLSLSLLCFQWLWTSISRNFEPKFFSMNFGIFVVELSHIIFQLTASTFWLVWSADVCNYLSISLISLAELKLSWNCIGSILDHSRWFSDHLVLALSFELMMCQLSIYLGWLSTFIQGFLLNYVCALLPLVDFAHFLYSL